MSVKKFRNIFNSTDEHVTLRDLKSHLEKNKLNKINIILNYKKYSKKYV